MVAGEVTTGLWTNSSELAKRGASDGKESIITEAAAESSATDEIEVPFGRVAQGKREILNILWSKVRNIEFCLNSSMQALYYLLLGFFPLPQEFEQVQGEDLPSDGVTHQDGCNSLEQNSGAAEQFEKIEAPLSFSFLKVYSSPLRISFYSHSLLQAFFVVFSCNNLKRYKEQAWRVTAKGSVILMNR